MTVSKFMFIQTKKRKQDVTIKFPLKRISKFLHEYGSYDIKDINNNLDLEKWDLAKRHNTTMFYHSPWIVDNRQAIINKYVKCDWSWAWRPGV